MLVNGDFNVNQRGQSSYTGGRYGLDMWLLVNGELAKNEIGITLNANDPQYNLILYQFVEPDVFKEDKGVIVAKINGIRHIYKINIGKESENEPYLFYDENNINLGSLYFYWNNSRNKYDVYISVNRTRSIQVEYIDLFEGTTAYLHVEEDYATALMRCQQYLRVGYYMGICIFSYSDGKKLFSFCYENMKSTATAKLNINYYTDRGESHDTTNYSIDSVLNGRVTFTLNDTTANAIQNGPVRIYAELSCEP